MSVSWTNYKGKKILYCDYRTSTNEDQQLALLNEEVERLRESPDKVLILSDFSGVKIGSKYMDEVKRLGKSDIQPKTQKSAIIGITGVKQILLKAYNMFSGDQVKAFSAEEQAKDYLVS